MASAVVFAYHDVGVRCLAALLDAGVDVRLVVTHDDDPRETVWFASVRELALQRGLRVITPEDPNDPALAAAVRDAAPDLLFSFYYRRMLPAALLALPRLGAFNMHGSLLPQFRGRSPVNWAIVEGARETGATLHAMDAKPDHGPLVGSTAVPILGDDTALDVFRKVTVAAELTLVRHLPALIAGAVELHAQDLSQGRYYGGRKPEDGRIDWHQPAARIHDLVRAVTRPFPGAFSETVRGRLAVWRTLRAGASGGAPELFAESGAVLARCGDGLILRILDAELDGRPLSVADLRTPIPLV